MKSNRHITSYGFTLIELLVVVSIIGMLASIVLAATNSARYKAKTEVMKAEFSRLRVALELFYEKSNSTWGNIQLAAGTCPSTAGTIFADADVRLGLNAMLGVFQGSTLECLAASDVNPAGPAITWTIMLSAPAYNGAGTNRWCMDNYDVGGRHNLLGGYSASGQSQTSGAGGYFVVRCVAYTSPDWR